MVGICDAASSLRRLALPSEDLYIDMEYFKFTSMNDLVNKVIAKTCDCATQGSMPSSISTASTATGTPVIETESSMTSATSSRYTTVTSTTSATTAKPSSTLDAETPTSDLTVPPTTTTTDGKTESPPLPSPHCFGDFIFVIDGSTDISQSVRIYS
uniref:VWFA domain-containing protein n=1 Tax=Parascaris univalens TaxID=6257 RepID=A0A915AQM2_PARUN